MCKGGAMRYWKQVLVICFVFVLVSFQPSLGSEETGFKYWRAKILPKRNEAAFEMTYKRSEIQTLGLEEYDDDEESQFNLLSVSAPLNEPQKQEVIRTHEMVQFNLWNESVLAHTVNNQEKVFLKPTVDSGDDYDIPSLDVMNPNYMGRGMLVSLFRFINTDGEGKAPGRITLGTAFLVSRSCLVTAGHNVVLSQFRRNHPKSAGLNPYAERVEFWPMLHGFPSDMFDGEGQLRDGATRAISVKLPLEWESQVLDCENHDIAVLKLDKALAEDFGAVYPTLLDTQTQELRKMHQKTPLCLSGYPKSGSETPCLMETCNGSIDEVEIYRAYYNVQPKTETGHSGCALGVSEDSTPPEFCGVHTGVDKNGKIRGVILNHQKDRLLGSWVEAFEEDTDIIDEQ